MGQAKNRGTFEQRQALAIERNIQEQTEKEQRQYEKRRLEKLAEEALPETERTALRKRRHQVQMLMAAVAGFGVNTSAGIK